MLRVDGQDVPGTEWLTPAGGAQPDLLPHPGPYSLELGYEGAPDRSCWASRDLAAALMSIRADTDDWDGAVYTVQGTDLWITEDGGETYIHMVAGG